MKIQEHYPEIIPDSFYLSLIATDDEERGF